MSHIGQSARPNQGVEMWAYDNIGTHVKVASFEGVGKKLKVETEVQTPILTLTGILEYASNSAAIAAGLTPGKVYRTGEFLKIVF